jgi:hypothetical protein
MTTKELVALRRRVFAEMVVVFETCDKGGMPVQDGLEATAALRHLHEATCRELDYADLETGIELTVDDIFTELDELADDQGFAPQIRVSANRCRLMLRQLYPSGGAA